MIKPFTKMPRRSLEIGVIILGLFFIGAIVLKATSRKTISKPIETNYSVRDPAFRNSLGNLLGPSFLEGHRFETLVNGDQFFPAMLQAIRGAQKTITLEMYIWESGQIGAQFTAALTERARAGVKIHVIVDGMGTLKLEDAEVDKMKAAGVRFVKFGRDRWYKVKLSLNHRTHRKLLVVDGKIGFTGGVCIGDKWMGNAEKSDHWRDTFYRVEGPAVQQMQGVFTENWLQTTGEVLQGADYFPEVDSVGEAFAQCFKSGPKDGEESARLLHVLAIAAARENIRLAHAYFVPDDLSIETLLAARKRGVKIQVIVPAKNDSKIGRATSRSRWGKLLDAGVEFFEYEPAMYHCKVMVVDDFFVTAGSINFDSRSFHLNDEANINVLDESFAATQIKVFDDDKQKSSPLTAAQMKKRPWHVKVGDFLAGFLRSAF